MLEVVILPKLLYLVTIQQGSSNFCVFSSSFQENECNGWGKISSFKYFSLPLSSGSQPYSDVGFYSADFTGSFLHNRVESLRYRETREKWEYIIHYISWFIITFIFIIKLSILYIVLNCIILSYILTFLDGHTGPQILSQPTVYRVHLGSQLKLSCNVSQLSGNQVSEHQYLSNCWRLR